MQPPNKFVESLNSQFGGKLRVRWSKANSEWQVEERVGRAIPPTRHVDEMDDRGIRWKDGYALLMRIRPGDRMPCAKCKSTVKIPVMEVKEAKCGVCGHRMMAYYFPLGDGLLEQLRKTDPNRGGYDRLKKELASEVDPTLVRLAETRENIRLQAREDFAQIAGHPVIGYTGKERYQ